MDTKRSAVALVGLAAMAGTALAQGTGPGQYPLKPIRLIILSTPASGPDIVGRLIGARLTESWGQQVVIDPRPGASGIIGAELASASAASRAKSGLSASWSNDIRRVCAIVSASEFQSQLTVRCKPSCVRKIGVSAPSSAQRSHSSFVLGPPLKPATSCVT